MVTAQKLLACRNVTRELMAMYVGTLNPGDESATKARRRHYAALAIIFVANVLSEGNVAAKTFKLSMWREPESVE